MKFLSIFLLLAFLSQPAHAIKINGQLEGALLQKLAADPAICSQGQIYFNTSDNTSRFCNGSNWKTVVDASVVSPDSGGELTNLGISVYESSGSLVGALKGRNGSAPSLSNTVKVGFRSTTATTGVYTQQKFDAVSAPTNAVTLILGTVDSIGATTAAPTTIYFYIASDVAANSDVCASLRIFDEGVLQSASAITGGADTDSNVLWCTSAHTSKPIRLIGKATATWTSGVGWGAPTNVAVVPFSTNEAAIGRWENSAGTSLASCAVVPFATQTYLSSGTWSGSAFTASISGTYKLAAVIGTQSRTWTATSKSLALLKNGSGVSYVTYFVPTAGYTGALGLTGSDTIKLLAGENISMSFCHNEGTDALLDTTSGLNHLTIERIGNY